MVKLLNVHPFPARMAPEIALTQLRGDLTGLTLLDPMCGSGTVLRAGVEAGLHVVGRDIDPLAVKIARVWASPPPVARFFDEVQAVLRLAEDDGEVFPHPVLGMDDESVKFVQYWFGEAQADALSRLAVAIGEGEWRTKDALWVTLSRLIITKDRGASLARDVSHSRPHKVSDVNDYDVFDEFSKSANKLARRFSQTLPAVSVDVQPGDSRALNGIENNSVDVIITSPPYLNAIDYLRGHRMSLVWMGHAIKDLRLKRSASIGAERMLIGDKATILPFVETRGGVIPDKISGWVIRYSSDARKVSLETRRVLKPSGQATFVVGNSNVRGCFVNNAAIYESALRETGLQVISKSARQIPAGNRYLPLPSGGSSLSKRMREEVVLTVAV